jgi:hypothetical protein
VGITTVGHLVENLAGGGPLLGAHSTLEILFDGADRALDVVAHALALWREIDQPGATVGGVG